MHCEVCMRVCVCVPISAKRKDGQIRTELGRGRQRNAAPYRVMEAPCIDRADVRNSKADCCPYSNGSNNWRQCRAVTNPTKSCVDFNLQLA